MDFFDLLEQECQSVITRISCLIVYHGIILSPKFQAIYNNYRKLFSFRNNNDYLLIYSKMTMIEECLLEDIIKTYEPFIQNIELPYGRFYISAWS
jgi:flavorubredoxin